MNYRQLQQELKEIKASGIKVNCRLNDKREVLHVEYARIVKNEVLAYDLVQSIGFHMADPNALFLCGVVFELIGDGNKITREIVDEFALSCGGDADEIWEGFMRQRQPEPQTEEQTEEVGNTQNQATEKPGLRQDLLQLMNVFGDKPLHFDAIIRKTGIDIGLASGGLLELEFMQLVRRIPGHCFELISI